MERSTFMWTLPWDRGARLAQIGRVAGTGATKVYVKAGGDTGLAWIPGVALPNFARPQWGPWLEDFAVAGLETVPWFYNWPVDSDKDCIVRALQARDAPEVVLNPETEWRWQNSNANPWHSLEEANAAAEAWVNDLRARLPHAVRVGFSAVPTWGDFPYEGFVRACDFALPQHYWFSRMFANNENEVEASVRREHVARAGQHFPTIAVLTACREYDDDGVIALAWEALEDDSETAGFSAWEAGNSAFQDNAMRAAYLLLPRVEIATTEEVVARSFVNAKGQPVTEINWGGTAAGILGTAYTDVGIRVVNAAGETYHRSIQAGAAQPWVKE